MKDKLHSRVSTAKVSRRTVAKGAAWAAPVAVLAANAPAYAASGPPPVISQPVGSPPCKLPGGSCNREVGITSGYVLPVLFTNTDTVVVKICSVYYSATRWCDNTANPPGFVFVENPNQPLPFDIPPSSAVQLNFLADGNNSANQCFEIDVCITWGLVCPDPDPAPDVCITIVVDATGVCATCTG